MFELLDGILAEKGDSCHYSVFTEDENVKVYININRLCDPKKVARFIRNIAVQLKDYKTDLGIAENKEIGGKLI
jgi:hypothetical protein